jgi:hypothetical protein
MQLLGLQQLLCSLWLTALRETADGNIRKCAVKMLRGVASTADKDEFLQEAEVMAKLKHDNLVRSTTPE